MKTENQDESTDSPTEQSEGADEAVLGAVFRFVKKNKYSILLYLPVMLYCLVTGYHIGNFMGSHNQIEIIMNPSSYESITCEGKIVKGVKKDRIDTMICAMSKEFHSCDEVKTMADIWGVTPEN